MLQAVKVLVGGICLVTMCQAMAASTCFTIKEESRKIALNNIAQTCLQLSGKKMRPEKVELMKQAFDNTWPISANVECASACKTVECVAKYVEDLTNGFAESVIPRLNAEWCSS